MAAPQRVEKLTLVHTPVTTPLSPSTVRIVHVSDTHCQSYADRIPKEGNIFIHSGDFTNQGSPEEYEPFAKFLSTLKYDVKIVVCGNHEFGWDAEHQHVLQTRLGTDVVILHDQCLVTHGIKFYGSPWNNSSQAWGAPPSERQLRWNAIPADTDVLITHQPPYGIMDLAWEPGNRYEHWGCKALADAVFSPRHATLRLHLFGHVHDETGFKRVGDILFSNAAMDLSGVVNVIDLVVPGAEHRRPTWFPTASPPPPPHPTEPTTVSPANIGLHPEVWMDPTTHHVLDLDAHDPSLQTVCLWKPFGPSPLNQLWFVQPSRSPNPGFPPSPLVRIVSRVSSAERCIAVVLVSNMQRWIGAIPLASATPELADWIMVPYGDTGNEIALRHASTFEYLGVVNGQLGLVPQPYYWSRLPPYGPVTQR